MNKTNVLLTILLISISIVAGYTVKQISKKNFALENSLPAFYATKFNITNVRSGPSQEYPILFVLKKKYLPIKAMQKHNSWIKIQGFDKNTGWIQDNLLIKTKTVLITQNETNIYIENDNKSKVLATADKFTIGILKSCNPVSNFCHVSIVNPNTEQNNEPSSINGWINSALLWGANIQLIKNTNSESN